MSDTFAQKREIVLKHLKLGHISGEDGEVFKIDEKILRCISCCSRVGVN